MLPTCSSAASAPAGQLRGAHGPAATAGTAASSADSLATPARRARASPLPRVARLHRYGRRGGGGGGTTVLPAGTHTQEYGDDVVPSPYRRYPPSVAPGATPLVGGAGGASGGCPRREPP